MESRILHPGRRHNRMLPSLALFAAFCAPFVAAAESAAFIEKSASLASLAPASVLAELSENARAVRTAAGSDIVPQLAPTHPAAATIMAELSVEKPSILVEALFLYKRVGPVDPTTEFRTIYGILRSIGSLEGIEYWSASRGKWRTFYAESYRIDSPQTKRRLSDEPPPTGTPPAEESLYAFQRDLSFGSNIYRYDYRASPGAIALKTTNLTRMSYSLVPVLGVEALRVRLLIVPTNEGILFYACSSTGAPIIPGLRTKLENSFTNRAEALFRWFSKRMDDK